jgi:hypothetical protein
MSNLVANRFQGLNFALLVDRALVNAKPAALAVEVVYFLHELAGSACGIKAVFQDDRVFGTILPTLEAMNAVFAMCNGFPSTPGTGFVLGGATCFQNDAAVREFLPVFEIAHIVSSADVAEIVPLLDCL